MEDLTPLEFLKAVYTNDALPLHARLKAAAAAAPFVHAKLAVVATTTSEDLAERMARALAITGKIIEGRATEIKNPAQVALPTPVEEQQVSAEHMKRPVTTLNRRL